RANRRAPPREAAADLQQARAVDGGADLRPTLLDRRTLVREHRARGVRVLDRERAAEAAALLGSGQVDELETADLPQQPERRVTHVRHAQRVARRVIHDATGEARADVLDAEPADQELGELEDALQPAELAD